jgi:hypothetical protein
MNRFQAAKGSSTLLFFTSLAISCGTHQHERRVGMSETIAEPGASQVPAPADPPGQESSPAAAETAGDETAATEAGTTEAGTSEAGAPTEVRKLPDAELVHRQRQLDFANELLKGAPTPEGQLGLVAVLGQRSADLYWTFAVENRGPEPVIFDSDLVLLELMLTPKAELESEPSSAPGQTAPGQTTPTQTAPGQRAATEAAPGQVSSKPVTCNPLTKEASNDRGPLLPGEAEIFSFDPRTLCPEELLTEGTTVSAIYGYAIENKAKWERGKKVEVLLTDKPPFVAQPVAPKASEPSAPGGLTEHSSGSNAKVESAPGIKQLFPAPIVLNETYPLDKLELFAESDPRAQTSSEAPPPPLSVTIRDLGETRTPTFQVVNVTLKNVSAAPLDIVVRRELMTFEVVGPRGATTCYLEPTQVDPLAHNFTRLAAGTSRVVVTRMPEICPAGTFSEPGDYSVFVRYRSPSDGAQFGRQGFQGEIRSKFPARLSVPDPLHGNVQAKPFRRPQSDSPG